jgi:hypothetical protein
MNGMYQLLGVGAEVHLFFGAYGAPVVILGGKFLKVLLRFLFQE